jgi:PAS domain S-box-containing protein
MQLRSSLYQHVARALRVLSSDRGYVVALVLVVLAWVFSFTLARLMGQQSFIAPGTLVAGVVAWLYGFRVGALATLLSVSLCIVAPLFQFSNDPLNVTSIVLLLLEGLVLSFLAGSRGKVHGSFRRVERHLNNFSLGVIEWDGDFRVRRWSRGAERLLGWSADEVLGEFEQRAFIHADDRAAFDEVRASLSDGKTSCIAHQHRVLRKDGGVLACQWHSSSLSDPIEGRSTLSLIINVAEREAALERLNAALIEVHHRVKNSLATVASLVQIELRGKESLPKEDVQKLIAGILSFSSLHDALMAQAKNGETGELLCAKEHLERLFPILERSAWDNAMVDRNLEPFSLTPKQCSALSLVVNELVTNSLKHGGKRISVSLERRSIGVAHLEIVDDGTGFEKALGASEGSGLALVDALCRSDLGGRPVYTNLPCGRGKVSITLQVRETDRCC